MLGLRRRRRSAGIVVVLAFVLVFGRAAPVGAFLSALDPAGWAVVAQMAAVISQAIAIKRQVENVRNQARASFFGKIAPLTGKLMTMRRHIIDMRSRASLDVIIPDGSIDMLPDDLPPFNQPPEDCVGNDFDGECLLPSRTFDAGLFQSLTAAAQTRILASPPGIPPLSAAAQTAYQDTFQEINTYVQQLHTFMEAELEVAETERARDRALVETLMGTVEDWRGCQIAPAAGGTLDTTVDDRVPCVTNQGRGHEDPGGATGVSGTDGLQQELAVQLEALETFQDGDASKTQIDSIQTKMLLQLARIQSARAEIDARGLERRQERAALAEASRRHDLALLAQNLECRRQFGPASFWKPAQFNGDPSVGECNEYVDRGPATLQDIIDSEFTFGG